MLSACLQDGLAAATSDEVHITRDREYGVQARRRGCMNYLQHQGQHKPLIGPEEGQDHKQPGKSGGWTDHASSSAVVASRPRGMSAAAAAAARQNVTCRPFQHMRMPEQHLIFSSCRRYMQRHWRLCCVDTHNIHNK
jgi:hypothetical protein